MVSMYAGIGLNTDLTKGVLHRFRSLPIWRPAVIVGALLGDAGRYLIASTLVIGLGPWRWATGPPAAPSA